MRTVWRIFTRDILRILRNPVAVVVTLGVAVIPALYAWFNILANWDPYSATGNLKVAVANEDKGVKSDLIGDLDAGKQVVDQLKKNDQLGWTFVDEEQALEGVRSGDYYAAIVLPKDFSESLVGSITGSSERAKIKYYVNEKKNAIAAKITDTGATTVDEQINEAFVSTVGDTLISAVSKAGDAVDSEAGKAQDNAVNELNGVIASLNTVQASLKDMQSTLDQTSTAIADAKKTTASLKGVVSAAQKASKQSGTLLGEARTGTQTFSNTLVGALDNGSVQLSGLAADANGAAGTVTDTLNSAQSSVDTVTNAVSRPLDSAAAGIEDLKQTLTAAGLGENTTDPIGQSIWRQISAISSAISSQQTQINTFHSETTQFIDSGKTAADNLSGAVDSTASGGIAAINTARNSLTGSIIPGLNSSLDGFAALNGTLSGTLTSLSGTLDQSDALFDQLSATIGQTKDTIDDTRTLLAQLVDDVTDIRSDIATLDSSEIYNSIKDSLQLDDDSFGEFLGSPVSLDTNVVYPVKNYGSSVTPFYTNLALWVGGFVLIAIYKLEVDRESLQQVSATQTYLGRWLLLVVIGFMQAIITMVGDLILGIQCKNPLMFVITGVCCSFVYINIIYALAVAFRHIGKAVAVVLVIIQIPGATGVYPIEMMPGFFRKLQPWLPFTYGIRAMRETIGGAYQGQYWSDLLRLFLYLPVALFVGLVVRRYTINLNALFDRRLGDTDLMITEHNSTVNERVSLSSVMRRLSVDGGADELRAVVRRRAHRFFARYPKLIRIGIVLLAVLPLVFLILLFVIPSKAAMLSAWIASIIIIDAFLIIVEYMRDSYERQLGVSAMSTTEFRNMVLHGYVWRRVHGHEGNRGAGRHAMPAGGKDRGSANEFANEADTQQLPPIGGGTGSTGTVPTGSKYAGNGDAADGGAER